MEDVPSLVTTRTEYIAAKMGDNDAVVVEQLI